MVASELHWIVTAREASWRLGVRRLAFLFYVAGGLIACTGAILDPRGAMEVLNSGAASGFLAPLGLFLRPSIFGQLPEKPATSDIAIRRSPGGILAAVVLSVLYIAVLGPG